MKMTLTQAITELEKLAADNEYIVVDEGTNECGSDYSIEHANTEHWDEIEVDYEPGSRCIDSDLYIYIDSKPYDAFGQLVSPNNDDLCWIYVKDNRSISTVIEYEGCNPNVCITDLADELVAYFPEAFAETKGTDGLCWVTFNPECSNKEIIEMIKTVAKDEMDLLKGDIKVDLPRRRARQGVK